MPSEPIKRSQYFIPPTTECPHTSRNHFEDWEEYHLPMARLHHAQLHDRGIASGFEVSVVSDTNEIEVQPGVAVDGRGELISLSALGEADISVNEPGESGQRIVSPFRLSTVGHDNQTLYVTVQYSQTPRLTEGSCGKLEQTPWLRLQAGEGTQIDEESALVLAIVSLDEQGVPTLKDRDSGLPHRRRLLGQKLDSIDLQRTSAINGTVDDVSSVQIGSDEHTGFRVTLRDASDNVAFLHENGQPFSTFDVNAENISMAGNLSIQGDATIDGDTVIDGKLSVGGSTASDSRLTLGNGTNEALLQFNAGSAWKFHATGEADAAALNLQALTNNKSFRVLAQDGLKSALHVQTSNSSQKNAVYLASSGGQVGVGTTKPNQTLTIEGGLTTFLNVRNKDATQELACGVDSDGGTLATVTNHDLRLKAGGTATQLIVKATGNVGVGTLTPKEKLEVSGRIKAGTLTVGQWPSGQKYVFFGNNTLNQAVQKNYALLQSGIGVTPGITFLNSPKEIRFRINNKDKMFLSGAGKLEIGTTSPEAPIHIQGRYLDVNPKRGGALIIGRTTGDNLAMDNNEIMARKNGKASRLFLNNNGGNIIIGSGKVGIGTGFPAKTLDVRGDAQISGSLYVKKIPKANKRNMQWDDRTGKLYYDNSSRKSKRNIRRLKDDFFKILTMECKTYTRPNVPGHQEIGCIAEEFLNAGLKNLVFYDEHDQPDGINYEKISLYLLEILKDNAQKLKDYESRIHQLEQASGQ